MANVGSLVVDLGLQSAQFMAGIRIAAQASTNFGRVTASAMSMAKGAIGGLGVMAAIDLFSGKTQEALDYADAIVDLSDRTGVYTGTIQQFRYAAQLSGSSIENADLALEKFTKNLGNAINGNKAMSASLNALGVNARDPDKALRQLMDGIQKLPTIAQQQAAATSVMGKSAADLTNLLGQGTKGFNELGSAAAAYGVVIDDHVLRNAGQVNDQMDTMKMILNAQMANAIIQNADALVAFANAAIQAGAAAANFFAQMNVNNLMSLRQGNPFSKDIPTLYKAWKSGKGQDAYTKEELMKTHAGRQALFKEQTDLANAEVRAGRKGSNVYLAALEGRKNIKRADVAAREAQTIVRPPTEVSGTFAPTGSGKNKPTKGGSKSATMMRSDQELQFAWEKARWSAENSLYSAQAALTTDPTQKAQFEADRARNSYTSNLHDISDDTGTDAQIREGKKRYTQAQAELLKQLEKQTFDAEYDRIIRDRDEEIAKRELAVSEAGLRNSLDELSSEQGLARSSSQRRDIAVRMVAKQFELERLQLEAVLASKDATEAEKEIARRRLAILGKLQDNATAEAKQQTQSPLEAYLDQIPRTSAEINEALESVEVEGLNHLQDGLMDVIKGVKSVGEAFGEVVDNVISGLLKIALQQMIIKPLGNLLFGGGEAGGGGGIFGSIFGKLIKGQRANGGYTGAGTYLVGERGPELATFGSNVNITPTRAIRNAANDNRGGVNISFGSITSNDPDAIRRAAMEGIALAMPTITQQAADKTMAKLQRRSM